MKQTIQQRFLDFHAKNPHVYTALCSLAHQAKQKGFRKIGISMLYEVLRWQTGVNTTGKSFRLSNDYRSRYARLIMDQEPELNGLFSVKELTTA